MEGSDRHFQASDPALPAPYEQPAMDIVRNALGGGSADVAGGNGDDASFAIVPSSDRRPAHRPEYEEGGDDALAAAEGSEPPHLPPDGPGLTGEGGEDDLAASEREAAAARAPLEKAVGEYYHMQPEKFSTREGHAIISVDPEDGYSVEAIFEVLAPGRTVNSIQWHEIPMDPAVTAALEPGTEIRFYTDAEHDPRFIAKSVAAPFDEVGKGDLYQADYELSVAPMVKQVIETDATQHVAQAYGFAGITFAAPIAGFVDHKSGMETIVYPYHDGFAVFPDHGEDTRRIQTVCNRLEIALANHGILATLEPGNFAVVTRGDGNPGLHLNCHQRNVFQVVPGFVPPASRNQQPPS